MCSSGSSIVLIRCSSDTQFYIYILYLEKKDAIQQVAKEAASSFGSFSYNNTASWVHLLNPEVYHTAPYRYKEGNFQLKDFIPISLLYKGFGNFLKLYTSQDPSNIDLDDMKFLQSFIISMAMIYPSEEDKRLVYVAKMIWTETENNTKHEDFVIVKFTNTYGVKAHKWMADIGGMALVM